MAFRLTGPEPQESLQPEMKAQQKNSDSFERPWLWQLIQSRTAQLDQIIKEQESKISKLEIEKAKLIREHEILSQELHQKLRSAHEEIEKLAGSDLELQMSIENNREASEKLESAKALIEEARVLKEESAEAERNADKKQADLERIIEERVNRRTKPALERIRTREEVLRDKENRFEKTLSDEVAMQTKEDRNRLSAREHVYSPYLFVVLTYSILVTVFAAISSPACLYAWTAFIGSIGHFLEELGEAFANAASGIGTLTASNLPDMWAHLIGWLILCGGIAAASYAAFRKVRRLIGDALTFLRQALTNRITAIAVLTTLAICVFFAGPVQAATHLNVFWWALIGIGGYIAARLLWVRQRH